MTARLVHIAEQALCSWLEGGRYEPPPLDSRWTASRPVFVTLYDAEGAMRGCVGHLTQTMPNLAEEVAAAAVAAGRDKRFPPLTAAEFPSITIEVALLGAMRAVTSIEELDPERLGIRVRSGVKTALLMPGIEGITTPEAQVRLALLRGEIDASDPVSIEVFEVSTYRDDVG